MLAFFLAALALSLAFTFLISRLAEHLKILDRPDGDRKRHPRPVALLGGVAIFFAFWPIIFYLLYFHPSEGINLIAHKLEGAFIASIILLVVGVLDEVKSLSPMIRLSVVALAIVIALASGIVIPAVTNPFGGVLQFGLVLADVVAFCWLMGIIFTVKILDGLDGLAAGVAFIGTLIIFFLTQSKQFYQPDVGLVSIILAGVLLGFLVFNFFPASIFLGESGGLFVGFMLGVLAIISGSKIATALLVMAVPMVDLLRVIYIRRKRHQPVFQGDREHLHFQLLTYGFSERQVVLVFYAIALVFGLAALFLQSIEKIIVLMLVGVGLFALGYVVQKNNKEMFKKM